MPTPIPSPLHSAINWLKASHLRLLIAGIVAVGIVASLSIFAADRTHDDEVTITNIAQDQNPQDGATVTQDFGFGYSFKPHSGLKQYNLRVTIDGRPVENRRHHNDNGWDGKKGFHYNFRYGMNEARTERTNGFDWNLLKPGTDHKLVVRACNNNVPQTDCKNRDGNPGQLDRKQVSFKVANQNRDAITTGMQAPITVYNAKTLDQSHIKDPTDTRLKPGDPATDPTDQNVDGGTVESGLDPAEESGENAGDTGGFDSEFTIATLDTILAPQPFVGKAYATHSITVQVNPIGLTPGFVTVEISPNNCSPSQKVVPAGGVVTFGGCADVNHSAIAHPGAFTNGNQSCVASVQSAPANNSAQLYYNCTPINPPGPQPPPGPVPGQTHSIKVSLNSNVDPKTINVPVTAFGGYCNDQNGKASNHVVKNTGTNGEVTFGGCTDNNPHSVSVPTNASTTDGTACVADNGTQRDIARLNSDWNPTFHFQCGGGGGGGGGGGDVVINRLPWISLTALGSQAAFIDVFKLGAGTDHNVGQVKEVRATVDGKVTDSHTPPVPSAGGHGYKYWPTIKHEQLNLGYIADGSAHQIKLEAISTRNVAASITVNIAASPPGPTPAPTEEPTPAPTDQPTQAPTEEPTNRPSTHPSASPTPAPPAPQEDNNGHITPGGTKGGGGLIGGLGSLPKTGQIGLIAFITFLFASAAYYGTQFYREHKQR